MRQNERASIMRIVSDMIKADAIIDTREIGFLDSLREKYSIKKDDEVLSSSYTLSQAINILKESSDSVKQDLLGDITQMAMSDNYCAREEALLLIAVLSCLTPNAGCAADIYSFDISSLYIDPTQILYVESEFDNDINWDINESYRAIISEIRLAGFDFVYLPKIAEHYRSISNDDLLRIASFLYPTASENRIQTVSRQLKRLSTSEFCKDQLAVKLGAKEFVSMPPSIMIKVGDSFVNDKKIANFLIMELCGNVLSSIRNIIDLFSEYYRTLRLNYLKEEKGRFIFTGFYKQVFDIYMLRKGVKSSVVIDCVRNMIWFPEADVKLEGLHRREKALYALFLLETASGGINFSKPDTPKQLARYNKRMDAVQEKYRRIYRKFGGEAEKAPDLSVPEIRLPMIALIKRKLKAFGEIVYHIDDYMIQRNIYGNYCIGISPNLCRCSNGKDIVLLSDSVEWQEISAL